LKSAYQRKRKIQKRIDEAEDQRRTAEEARGAAGWLVSLAELKGESDYRAGLVKEINKRIAE